MHFEAIEPEGINTMDNAGQAWEEVKFHMDSGATETVVPEEALRTVELKEGMAKRRGVTYEVANGVRIPNLGEKEFSGVTEEGFERGMTAQVCEVNKALLSVRRVVRAGNRVVFDDGGSYVESKSTGERMWMKEENGMYILNLWVKTSDF